jgi:FlaA1/EpsC-like NDP-sugar epimerase
MIKRINRTFLPSWLVLNLDLAICFISILLAFLFRFNFKIPDAYVSSITIVAIVVLVIRAITFLASGAHRAYLRHASIKDFVNIIITIFAGSVLIAALNWTYFAVNHNYLIPISIIFIDFFISTYLMVTMRVMAKFGFMYLSRVYNNNSSVLIYGSQNLAISVKRALDLDHEANYRVSGFINHDSKVVNKTLEGKSIYHYSDLEQVIDKYSVKKLILAESKIPAEIKNFVAEVCLNRGVKVLSVRNLTNWLNNDNQKNTPKLKEIKIEDLLERDPIILDTKKLAQELSNKCILVTGAAGSIGSEIVRQAIQYNPQKIILLDQAETPLYNMELELLAKSTDVEFHIEIGDITNRAAMEKIFIRNKIDVVYHAAAYKHVPMMEGHPDEAVLNNVFGSKNIADLSLQYDVKKFVMISTDKAVNPTNIMGTTKRIAELYTQSLNGLGETNFIITRFGNVLGSNGSVIPLFKQQIEMGGPLTVTHPDVTRYFMTIPEACQLVLEASVMGNGGEIFIFDMGKSVKISDLAKNMIRLAGYEVDKDIAIKYVGLRPGEKLYEELLNQKENTIPTHHPKIMKAKVYGYDHRVISEYINQFREILKSEDQFELVRLMKKVVPEFVSQNSDFEVLDQKK